METYKKENLQVTERGHEVSITQQWINQHCSLERYVLALFITFHLLHRFHINPQSRFGKIIIFVFFIFVILGLPIIVTATLNQWESAPLGTWAVIAIIFAFVVGASYDTYYNIGQNVCSIGHTASDKTFFYRQINWDRSWFNLRISGTVGAVVSVSMLASLAYIDHQTTGTFIPGGNLLIICVLAYQLGEIMCVNLLMCFEARNLSEVEHSLFRFNPLKTYSLQKYFTGYNQFGLVTSLVITVFIACSAILLPNSAYLTNPVWLFIVFAVYTMIIFVMILPRHFVQQMIHRTKHRQLKPIRQKLNTLFDRITNLSDEEHQEMLRLVNIQDMISRAPESSLPVSTIGRLFGTLILPTLTFVLAVLGEAYISALLQQVFD